MKNYLYKSIVTIIFAGVACVYSCKKEEDVRVEMPKFEYTPGNPSELKIAEPEKVAVTGLSFEVNHAENRSNQTLSMAFDGDMSTKYHSPWATETPPTQFPVILTVTLPDDAPLFEYLLYWPRQVGSNGRLLTGEVKVATREAPNSLVSIYEMDYQDDALAKKISVPSMYQGNIKKLVFHITSGVNDVASIQEIEFYNEGAGVAIPDVFTDKSCSSVKAGVTRNKLDTISNSVFRNLALSLYDETYDMRRVNSYESFIHPYVTAKENKTGTYGLLDNVTGIYVEKDDDLIVLVGEHSDELGLRIIDHTNDDASGFSGQNVALKAGVNKVKAESSGLVYLLYHNDSEEQVKVNFANGQVNNFFDISRNTNAEWTDMLNSAVSTHIDMLGNYSHIIFPVEALQRYTPDPTRLIEVMDSVVWLEEQFIGLYKYNRTNKTRMCFRGNGAPAYMHATAYRTEYNPSTMHKVCDVANLRTTEIWGPAHEVGHINQTRPGFKWNNLDGEAVLTEVSNNVYSLYVQAAFGNPSRLEEQGKYVPAFNSFMVDGVKHLDAIGKVDKKYFWEQLVHFWQLELYFSQVRGQTDFYKDLHEEIRITEDPAKGTEHYEFAYKVSKVSGYDMTDFFNRWGYELSDDVKARIAALGNPKPEQPLHYIRESVVDCFKENKSIVEGTATKYNSAATYTFQMNGFENVLAYEVYVDGTLSHVDINNQFTVTLPEGTVAVYAIGANGETVEVMF